MAVRDDRSDVKQTTTGFRGPLMVQSLTSAKSKFLSLSLPTNTKFNQHLLWQAALLLSLYLLLFPALKLFTEYGYFFYTNGHDEADYLSYEFSKKVQGLRRPSSFIVTYLHQIGLSGGTINFLFDVIALTLVGFLVPRFVKKFYPNVRIRDQYIASFIICLTPMLLTIQNPLITDLISTIKNNELLKYYFVYGQIKYPSYLRTPENQFSFIITISVLWRLARVGKAHWIVLFTPFMYYPFAVSWFAIVFIYCVATFIYQRNNKKRVLPAILWATLACFTVLGSLQAIVFRIIQPSRATALINHEPVFGTSLLILAILFILLVAMKKQWMLDNKIILFLSSCFTAMLVVYNTQILNGYILQPQHFEFVAILVIGVFAGLFYLSVIVPISNKSKFAFTGIFIFAVFYSMIDRISVDYEKFGRHIEGLQALRAIPEFEEAVRSDERRVAINSIELSSEITGLYLPKGRALITAREKAFIADDDNYSEFAELKYCVALRGRFAKERMKPVLAHLEHQFATRFENWMELYQYRRKTRYFKYANTTQPGEVDCSRYSLFILQ
jgi:hypothetical protein